MSTAISGGAGSEPGAPESHISESRLPGVACSERLWPSPARCSPRSPFTGSRRGKHPTDIFSDDPEDWHEAPTPDGVKEEILWKSYNRVFSDVYLDLIAKLDAEQDTEGTLTRAARATRRATRRRSPPTLASSTISGSGRCCNRWGSIPASTSPAATARCGCAQTARAGIPDTRSTGARSCPRWARCCPSSRRDARPGRRGA